MRATLKVNHRNPLALPKYANLGVAHRGDPCEEYPGQWLVYASGKEETSHASFGDAFQAAQKAVDEYDSKEQDAPIRVSICWQCSDNDPRIGEVWFTGFYQHGKFNQYGQYKS